MWGWLLSGQREAPENLDCLLGFGLGFAAGFDDGLPNGLGVGLATGFDGLGCVGFGLRETLWFWEETVTVIRIKTKRNISLFIDWLIDYLVEWINF